MNTEIDITSLFAAPSYDPWNCSNSVANLGDNAGRLTWESSKRAASSLVLTDDEKAEFRDFVKSSGGWTCEEIDAWDDEELTALCVQWVSGDVREAFGDDLPDDFSEWDWAQYQEDANAGRIAGRIYLHDNKLYWNCSS